MTVRFGQILVLVATGVTLVGCGSKETVVPRGERVTIKVPLGLPPLPIPPENPPTVETVALGRALFYDPILSRDDTVSCASCHQPDAQFADRRKFSSGVGGQLGKRHAPTIVNSAYLPLLFWDGRAAGLEEQAGGPIANPVEMAIPHEDLVNKLTRKLNSDKVWKDRFDHAFGEGRITIRKVEDALASFERTVLSGNSPFDRYQYGGDKSALSPEAVRGLALFQDPKRGNCVVCHTIEHDYALFTDGKFHNLGVGVDSEGNLTDLGRYEQTKKDSDKGAFKTPTLRNVAQRHPYMHDGSKKTLREVIDFYKGGGNANSYLDKEIHELNLSGQDRDDLIAFLESLTGEMPQNIGPASAPIRSGL